MLKNRGFCAPKNVLMDVSYINCNSSQAKFVLKINFNQFTAGNPKNFTETTGCTAEVRQCKFPFIFHDMEYTECTNDLLFISDYDDRTKESFKWCATSTNDDNSMKKGKWGRCDEATCQ